MAKLRAVCGIVDTTKLTIYLEDGKEIYIQQGDDRLPNVIEQLKPLSKGLKVVEIDLESVNKYKEFEEQTGGIVKFFRALKKKVAHIFAEPVPVQNIGTLPPLELNQAEPVQEPTTEPTKLDNAIEDIMAHAEPISDANYSEDATTDDHTIVAVVDNKIIPGMENLQKQFKNSTKLGSTVGVENFLKRIATVIDKRGHSIDDLLRFMEHGDLPIADDGSIVAYKRLYRQGSKQDVFVDPHTRNVTQKVGSHVFMNEKLVDPNRRNECSNGLHVGRRAYMGSFSGDVITIIKIAPEDVIAVPEHDRNKMRVCGYHILGVLSPAGFSAICSNRPMTEHSEDAKLLGQAISGQHVGILQIVEITEGRGGGLKINSLVPEAHAAAAVKQSVKDAEKAKPVLALDDEKSLSSAKVNPVEVAKTHAAEKANQKTPRQLFEAKELDTLKALKKQKKVSWTKLGFNQSEINQIEHIPNSKTIEALKEAKAVSEKKAQPASVKKVKVTKKVETPSTYKPEKLEADMNREEKARHFFRLATENKSKPSWTHLWQLKKQAKKSWKQLGFTDKEAERIETNKPDHI